MNLENTEYKHGICSLGLPVNFLWYERLENATNHAKLLEDALFAALQSNTRRWTPHRTASVKGAIRQRLEEASRGELTPPDMVKSIRPPNDFLYEIRWQDLTVTDEVNGRLIHSKTNLRLLYAEPEQLRWTAVGLGAFEKPPTPDSKTLQDKEIDLAVRRFFALDAINWRPSAM